MAAGDKKRTEARGIKLQGIGLSVFLWVLSGSVIVGSEFIPDEAEFLRWVGRVMGTGIGLGGVALAIKTIVFDAWPLERDARNEDIAELDKEVGREDVSHY